MVLNRLLYARYLASDQYSRLFRPGAHQATIIGFPGFVRARVLTVVNSGVGRGNSCHALKSPIIT